MPTFDTPGPISVDVDLGVGDLRIVASDREDTVVDVRPRDAGKPDDVEAAAGTRVEFAGGRLVIATPKRWRRWTPFGGAGEWVDVRIELPTGSEVRGHGDLVPLRSTGRIGDCRYRTGMGDISLEDAGVVNVKTGFSDVTVGRASGPAEIISGSGAVRVERIDGPAVVRNGNGDTWIGEVTGDLRVKAANGAIVVGAAGATVAARSANGRIELGEVVRGAVDVQTAAGGVEVGVREGVPAWLDLHTKFGTVRQDLEETAEPGPDEAAVEIHARTSYGDITVHRSTARPSEERVS